MENRLDVPDEDVLEEFEEIGNLTEQPVEDEDWKGFEHTSWDDADLDDRFVQDLLNELEIIRKETSEAAAAGS